MKKILTIALVSVSLNCFSQLFIGTANDARSALSLRPMIDCYPPLNAVSFVYSSAPTAAPNKLYSNFSTDGGDNWQSAGGNLLLNNLSPANAPQYPCNFIYNDSGNSIPDSSYLHWFSPIGSSGAYPGFRYGSTHPFHLPTTTIGTSSITASVIPADGIITQRGETYLVFPPSKGNIVVPDTLHILHGEWNDSTHNMNYSEILIELPLGNNAANVFRYHHAGIAFGNDGLTGYVYLLGHHDLTLINDSSYYPIIYKTTDGGATWSPPKVVSLDSCNALLMTSPTLKYSAAYEADATVDANNNLHIVTAVAPLLANNKLNDVGGQWGLFDIFTNDQGNTWNAELLHQPQTFSASYGSGIYTYSRAQASRTWNGSHLFFTWFDSDTLASGTTQNTHPNVFIKAYDVNTNQWTITDNKTAGTPSHDLAAFGMVAPYVLESAPFYEVPVAVALGSLNPNNPADYRYLNDLYVDSSSFTQASNSVLLTSGFASVHQQLSTNNGAIKFSPNPAVDLLTVQLLSDLTDNSNCVIQNLLGEEMLSQYFNKGQQQLQFNVKNLKAGVYLFKIVNSTRISTGLFVKE